MYLHIQPTYNNDENDGSHYLKILSCPQVFVINFYT